MRVSSRASPADWTMSLRKKKQQKGPSNLEIKKGGMRQSRISNSPTTSPRKKKNPSSNLTSVILRPKSPSREWNHAKFRVRLEWFKTLETTKMKWGDRLNRLNLSSTRTRGMSSTGRSSRMVLNVMMCPSFLSRKVPLIFQGYRTKTGRISSK